VDYTLADIDLEVKMTWPKPENDFCIYALCCPETGEVRYVGQTTNGITRLYGHWKDFKLNKQGRLIRVKAWIKNLKSRGLKFTVKYLDYGSTREELNQKEIFWIKHYRSVNANLVNAAEGGYRGSIKKYTDEEKRMISEKTKAAMARPDVRARYLEANKNKIIPKKYKPWTTENRQKMSKTKHHESVKIKVIDNNGVIYDSLTDAANKLGVSKQTICRALKNLQKTVKGLILRRL